jgi:DeoR family transcriptional regulator, fructose operon transcriptional repressor
MMPEERRLKIIEIVYKHKRVSVKDLCDQLFASEATIRRDLTLLEDEKKLERTHGGAIIRSTLPIEKEDTFQEKEGSSLYEKKLIALHAFSLLKENDAIFIDGGTTTLELAKLIGRCRLKLSVFTNASHFSTYIATNPKAELFMIGGRIRNTTLAVVGQLAVDTIRRFRLTKVFIGVNGVSIEYGLTTPDFEEAEIKRAILESGRERIVLIDPSKFNKAALCEILPISAIDMIITCASEPLEIAESFRNIGVQFINAQEKKEGWPI